MDNLLEVRNLRKHYPVRRGLLNRTVGYVKAVDKVTFNLTRGETLGLVGESGCGKTTLGRCILGLIKPTEGQVLFGTEKTDLCKLNSRAFKTYRPRMQMVFQDPYSSLNPRMTVADIIAEPLKVNKKLKNKVTRRIVEHLLERVSLSKSAMSCYPRAFSGGQRQRIAIARSLVLEPELVIADEPVSALDVSVQARILNLLVELKKTYNLSYIFIAHDLSVIRHISDRIAVMYLGKIMEISPAEKLCKKPLHPYTGMLLASVPNAKPGLQGSKKIVNTSGDVPQGSEGPDGCVFRSRCSYAQRLCSQQQPLPEKVDDNTVVACHFSRQLSLTGI